ncbi:MAG: alpha/beta hydrolase-fold protein [Byssovorax sp.]
MHTVRRRSLLQAGAALTLAACHGKSKTTELPVDSAQASSASPAPPRPAGGAWRTLSFDPIADMPEGERALMLLPDHPERAPVLLALHGRGEAGRGLDIGAGAWPREYALDRMHRRLLAPPLTAADLENMLSPARLQSLNDSLAKTPYQGLCVACPATPVLADRSVDGARAFGRFLVETLLPRARNEAKGPAVREATGIDGVSMGGRIALFVGLTNPQIFGAVGALQPAIKEDEAEMIAKLAAFAMGKVRRLALRLVSSDDDPFLPAVRAASAAMRAIGVQHELLVIPGTHGYEFNRGPGGAEMLLWHERVLRGLPPP